MPLGSYMAKVYEGEKSGLDSIVGPIERLIYRLLGISPDEEMSWKGYAGAAILFKLAFLFLQYALMRLQGILPLNPQNFSSVSPDLAFNTAVSFITNTNSIPTGRRPNQKGVKSLHLTIVTLPLNFWLSSHKFQPKIFIEDPCETFECLDCRVALSRLFKPLIRLI